MIIIIRLLQLYQFILLARVIMSYFPNVDPSHPAVRFLIEITEPVLAPVRELLQRQFGYQPLDFSPIIVWIAILILIQILAGLA